MDNRGNFIISWFWPYSLFSSFLASLERESQWWAWIENPPAHNFLLQKQNRNRKKAEGKMQKSPRRYYSEWNGLKKTNGRKPKGCISKSPTVEGIFCNYIPHIYLFMTENLWLAFSRGVPIGGRGLKLWSTNHNYHINKQNKTNKHSSS